jgi:hypothetical protein
VTGARQGIGGRVVLNRTRRLIGTTAVQSQVTELP